jgi:ABC-type transport system substrate-binding protein
MSEGFDRRSFLARSGMAAAGAALGGVASDLLGTEGAGAVQSNGPGRNGISRQAPKRGGSVTIGLNAEEQGFNPTTGRLDTAGFMYARTVFDPLMAITATGQAVPYLAQSLAPNGDYTQWTITLRPNLKFHDGTPCDGAALLANVDAQYKSPLTGIVLDPLIASYAQSGPLSVTITATNPWVSFPFTLAEQQISFVAAPSMLNAPKGGTDHPIGTGPFMFKEWVPNDHFTAVANPSYWRPGLPYLSQVTFKPIPDEQARAEALQSGSIDMMHTNSASNIKQFYGSRSWAYTNNVGAMVGSPALNLIMLNCAQPPFDELLARQIVATGTNAKQYSKILDEGVMAPVNGLFLPGSPYYSATQYPKYDQTKATKLARQYATKSSKPLSFSLNVVAAPQFVRQAEWFQQVMKNIGVAVAIKTMQQNELIDQALFGSFQATVWSQFGGISPDINYPWMSTDTLHATGLSINMARNDDPLIQQAFIQGMGATNESTARAAFATVNKRLGADLPYIWLDRSAWALVSTPKVQNWNSPKAPGGQAMLGQEQGEWWITQMWKS